MQWQLLHLTDDCDRPNNELLYEPQIDLNGLSKRLGVIGSIQRLHMYSS